MAGLPPGFNKPKAPATATMPSSNSPSTAQTTTPTESKGFQFTDDDVAAAATSLLAALPEPKQVQSSGPRKAMALTGPKGGKTIASVAVKTSKCGGLPLPEGAITVVIHTDDQAPDSFENFLYENDVHVAPEHMPHFIGLGEPVGDYKARLSRADAGQSWYVYQVILEVMRRLGERGDVGLFVFDGYGDFCSMYGGYVAAHRSGLDSPLKLEGTQWYPRREMFEDLTSGGKAAVIPGGFAIFNGPAGGLENEKKDMAKLRQRLKKEGFAGREPPAKWLMYRENNMNMAAIFDTTVGSGADGAPTYAAEVWEGRLAKIGIRTGAAVDITGRNIGAFCDGAQE